MTKIKVDCVLGTRPEAIKMAPVVLALMEDSRFHVRVVATGQHTDMLDQALSYFKLKADENLKIMRERQTLDHITASVLEGTGALWDVARPDAVLVHGDTTTTFASTLAAFYRDIPVGHVEAGLRSCDIRLPFPEEMNRLLTDRISSWWFAPTPHAMENLNREGIVSERLIVTGNTVVDALKYTVERTHVPSSPEIVSFAGDGEFLLLTAHRRESWGQPMRSICRAFREILSLYPEMHGIVPMHKNPQVRDIIRQELGDHEHVRLCEPLDYPDFIWCMSRARLILSDSGGVQEEATALSRPVLILRNVTERPEAVEMGSGILVGTDPEKIIFQANRLLSSQDQYDALVKKCELNPFGDGTAAHKIVSRLAMDLIH